jgi:hypothetical protein
VGEYNSLLVYILLLISVLLLPGTAGKGSGAAGQLHA